MGWAWAGLLSQGEKDCVQSYISVSPYMSCCYLCLLQIEQELMQQSAAKLESAHRMFLATEASGSVPDVGQHGFTYVTTHIYK